MPLVDKEKRRLPLAGIKPEDTSASTHEQVVWLEVMVPDTAFVAESNAIAELVHHDLHAQYHLLEICPRGNNKNIIIIFPCSW